MHFLHQQMIRNHWNHWVKLYHKRRKQNTKREYKPSKRRCN